MNQNDSKKLLEDLLLAISTENVASILERYNFSNDDWKPYGGRQKNWDIVSNQQTNAVGALTEIITNAIDAVLCRKAYEGGITDLASDRAPQSMQEAVRKFYGVTEGKLSSLEANQLTDLATESIWVGVKRKRKGARCPTITIVDFGEGQSCNDFPKTFLSLSETNKEGIGFVQGKFNMGSTGSIRFCTESDITRGHYKLIVSKRYDGEEWGWTLIRVSQVQEGKKLPVVEYLMPNGEIPSFKQTAISAFGSTEVGEISQGSVVRLYEYDIGPNARAVDFGLYYALTLNLLDCALPIKTYDFDAKPSHGRGRLRSKGIAERTFSGMAVMLNTDFKDPSDQDPEIPEQKPDARTTEFVHLVGDVYDGELGSVKILATGVSELPEFMKDSRKRIFYTINGQTHATENAGFLNRSTVRLGDLQNHLIVNVQCENMDKTALTTIFMGNREQKVNTRLSRKLDEILQKQLKEDSKLREYKAIIRRRRATQIVENDKETKKLLSDLIVQDPQIRELLGLGSVAIDKSKAPGGKQKWTEGKRFPTFLDPLNVEKNGEKYIKRLPIDGYRQIKCATDASNDYLSRSNSPGWVYPPVMDVGARREASLHNGTATFTFWAPEDTMVGDELSLEIGFHDHGPRGVPLSFPLTLVATEGEKKKANKTGTKTDTRESEKPNIADPTQWVEKSDWQGFGFNEQSGAIIYEEEKGMKVYVNRNHEKLEELRRNERDSATLQLNEARFKICLGFLALAVYRHHKRKDEDGEGESAQEKARAASDAMAPYIIPLIAALGGAEQI